MKYYGPYLRKDNRLMLIIKKDDGKVTSLSYPKFLMEEELSTVNAANDAQKRILAKAGWTCLDTFEDCSDTIILYGRKIEQKDCG